MWKFIDKVVYINLDHRQDRRDIMKQFFQEGQIPEEKIYRFSAISHPVGAVGCTMSHIGVLNLAKLNKWKSILILEDDVKWNNFKEDYNKLTELLTNTVDWDVCMLGGAYIKLNLPYVSASHSTFSYIVKEHYYDTLLNNFNIGLSIKLDKKLPFRFYPSKKSRIDKYYELVSSDSYHCLDTYWVLLQERDKWICMLPMMTDHVHTFSDVRNKYDYIDILDIYKYDNGDDRHLNLIKMNI